MVIVEVGLQGVRNARREGGFTGRPQPSNPLAWSLKSLVKFDLGGKSLVE